VATQTNARIVLGEVPVEPDGSAHFIVPAGRPVYFQALDEKRLAITSMRSATYFQPGERATCQGCHERTHQAPPLPLASTPMALRRGPSRLTPPPEGANPFSYPRLVQPVLDRHCVSCHEQKDAVKLSGNPAGAFTQSYVNLAGKYGFYFNVGNGSIRQKVHGGSRTVAGGFGARAAKLLEYLEPNHHGVNLTPDEYHRVTLWLDCNSEFLGAYEQVEAQQRGHGVNPSLE
jgi:hypothetical protein